LQQKNDRTQGNRTAGNPRLPGTDISEKDLHPLDPRPFSENPRGTVYDLMIDACAGSPELTKWYQKEWKSFDAIVYRNLQVMDRCGFISVDDEEPVGLVSWDPRDLPDSVRIGHT
jgi:hypothetical protein